MACFNFLPYLFKFKQAELEVSVRSIYLAIVPCYALPGPSAHAGRRTLDPPMSLTRESRVGASGMKREMISGAVVKLRRERDNRKSGFWAGRFFFGACLRIKS